MGEKGAEGTAGNDGARVSTSVTLLISALHIEDCLLC